MNNLRGSIGKLYFVRVGGRRQSNSMDDHTLNCLDFGRVRELLAGYALTELGRGLAETIKPMPREQLVRRWFAQYDELRGVAEEHGQPPFGGLTDVRETVKRCAPPLQVAVEDVARIGDALAATHAVVQYLTAVPESCSELRHISERIGDFGSIAERIHAVIDERGQVRDDASRKLADIRAQIVNAMRQIRTTVDRLLHDHDTRRLLQYPNYTFHNDRLVFPVRAEYRGRMPGIVHRSSGSGATIYVEPSQAVELNNIISNLRGEEAEEISRLLWELAHEIHINADQIIKTLDALAVLDLLSAKLRFAADFGLCRPRIESAPILDVREARHPLLLELFRRRQRENGSDEQVVPISYRLGDDFNLLIVTGPNTGGKTVAIKTVGLLTLMVQAGLPVPVDEGSRFGVFKRILIDIGDEQNMQQSLSTFSAHLMQQLGMLSSANPEVLVLIDELGAGTDPDEGAAIGKAILDDLLRLGARCMVTTHIGALKSFPLTRKLAENACVEFDAETLKPTYRMRIGEAGQSNAIEIATRLGMPRRLVKAARKNLSHRARTLKAALEGAAGVKREAEKARTAAESARQSADRAETEAGAARAALEKKQAEFEQWVQRVVHLQAGDPVRVRGFDRDGRVIRMKLDQQRAEIDVGSFSVEAALGDILPPATPPPPPRPPRPKPASVAPAKPKHARKPENQKGGEGRKPRKRVPDRHDDRKPKRQYAPLTAEQLAALRPGDKVTVKRLHRAGSVVRCEPAKKVAFVSVGLFEVEVPYDGLASTAPVDSAKPRQPAERTHAADKPKPAGVRADNPRSATGATQPPDPPPSSSA